MSHVDPDSPDIVEDIQRAIAEKAAVKRAELWESMGFPQSAPQMVEADYERDYRGRIWFCNREVMEQGMRALRIILCPKCVEDQQFGVKGTRFYITVEDDVMTVFPAVGHFLCHHCGFEEWHPMKQDIRVNSQTEAMSATEARMRAQMAAAQMQQHQHAMGQAMGQGLAQPIGVVHSHQSIGQALGGQLDEYRNALANKLGAGMNPGMGPIWGITEEEQRSLYRLYQQQQNKQSPPPKIVESQQEAEMLLKLAPVERRQAIIQKLRDAGHI